MLFLLFCLSFSFLHSAARLSNLRQILLHTPTEVTLPPHARVQAITQSYALSKKTPYSGQEGNLHAAYRYCNSTATRSILYPSLAITKSHTQILNSHNETADKLTKVMLNLPQNSTPGELWQPSSHKEPVYSAMLNALEDLPHHLSGLPLRSAEILTNFFLHHKSSLPQFEVANAHEKNSDLFGKFKRFATTEYGMSPHAAKELWLLFNQLVTEQYSPQFEVPVLNIHSAGKLAQALQSFYSPSATNTQEAGKHFSTIANAILHKSPFATFTHSANPERRSFYGALPALRAQKAIVSEMSSDVPANIQKTMQELIHAAHTGSEPTKELLTPFALMFCTAVQDTISGEKTLASKSSLLTFVTSLTQAHQELAAEKGRELFPHEWTYLTHLSPAPLPSPLSVKTEEEIPSTWAPRIIAHTLTNGSTRIGVRNHAPTSEQASGSLFSLSSSLQAIQSVWALQWLMHTSPELKPLVNQAVDVAPAGVFHLLQRATHTSSYWENALCSLIELA